MRFRLHTQKKYRIFAPNFVYYAQKTSIIIAARARNH